MIPVSWGFGLDGLWGTFSTVLCVSMLFSVWVLMFWDWVAASVAMEPKKAFFTPICKDENALSHNEH